MADSRVRCVLCGHMVELEPLDEHFRCGQCRSALDKNGQRFRGESELRPAMLTRGRVGKGYRSR